MTKNKGRSDEREGEVLLVVVMVVCAWMSGKYHRSWRVFFLRGVVPDEVFFGESENKERKEKKRKEKRVREQSRIE